jgi:WD40 repeat protein
MNVANRKNPRLKKIVLVAGSLFLAFFVLFSYDLWIQPRQVNNGIGTLHRTFSAHSERLWSVMFSPKGETLASGDVDGNVKIWQRDDGKVIRELKQPMGITYLAYSPDGDYLATASYDSQVRLWRVSDGLLMQTFSGHANTVWCVAFSPDGRTLASSGEDKTIRLWDVKQGNLLNTFEGHSLIVWSVAFSPDGNHLASGSFDETVKIWKLHTGELERTITGHSEAILEVAFSPNGQILASGSDDKTVKFWNVQDGSLIRTLSGGSECVYAVAFSPDGKQLLSGSRDRSAIGEIRQNFLGASEENRGVTVRLWNVEDGNLMQTFTQHTNDVHSVAFSPDGKWIASTGEDQRVCIWRLNHTDSN